MIVDRLFFIKQWYKEWSVKRCSKVLEIYGVDYFKDKRILDLGSGHGEIGAFFAELGAKVLCIDGRIQNINFAKLKHRNVANLQFSQFNLEADFSEFGKFDVTINFGLLYHLKNVDAHLKCCFATSDDIILETCVCDSINPYKIFFLDEPTDILEAALEGPSGLPSPFSIERLAEDNNFEPIRFFTADLNLGNELCYDWKHENDDRLGEEERLRRFWRLKKVY